MRATQLSFLCAALALACGPSGPQEPTASGSGGSSGASESSSSGGTTLSPTSSGSTSEGGTSEGVTTGETTAGPTTGPTTEVMSSTSIGPGGSSGSSSGGSSTVCEAAALLEMKDAVATPDMGPTWEPGETVTVGVTLVNPGAVDFTDYPGIRVSADHPGVTPAMAENWLFALLAGMETPITVSLMAAPDVPAPSTITFTIELAVLNQTCPDLPSLELAVEIG